MYCGRQLASTRILLADMRSLPQVHTSANIEAKIDRCLANRAVLTWCNYSGNGIYSINYNQLHVGKFAARVTGPYFRHSVGVTNPHSRLPRPSANDVMTLLQPNTGRPSRSVPAEDTVFDVLSSHRRRRALRVLHHDGPVELKTLAERVAKLEADGTQEELGADVRKRVYISCYQTHVPRLAEADLVEYDTDSGMVKPTAELDDVAAFLGWHAGQISPYPILSVALAATGMYVGVLLGLPILNAVPHSVAGAIVVLSFLAIALYVYARSG